MLFFFFDKEGFLKLTIGPPDPQNLGWWKADREGLEKLEDFDIYQGSWTQSLMHTEG